MIYYWFDLGELTVSSRYLHCLVSGYLLLGSKSLMIFRIIMVICYLFLSRF